MSFRLRPVYGTMSFGAETGEWSDDETVKKGLAILKEHGVNDIDTAQVYGKGASELCLGRVGAAKDFTIDTKWVGGWAGSAWASEKTIIDTARQSLEKLHTEQVDIFYLHSPDNETPYEETLKGVDQAHRNGWFKRLGISNFTPNETRKVLEICKKNNYVMPSVYQGSYSAAARKAEDELIPLLRDHNIAFYAYSPIAGGFLTKSRQFVVDGEGRFGKDASLGIYQDMYHKKSYLNFLDEWNSIAQGEKVSKAELAFRWVNHHSVLKPEFGDGIVFGATKISQITETCGYLQAGPLSEDAATKIDALWKTVRDVSTINHWQAAINVKR